MIIADTNVVSEFMRDAPDPGVLVWAGSIAPADLSICVVTVEEIERGLGRLPVGRRRRDLENRWTTLVEAFADAVVIYDLPAARQTASILVAAQAAGRRMSLADAQIAGICIAGGHELATRNTDDFSTTAGLSLINPFEH
ncbi:type II toxin-antitoxin system VapC family toxin [Phycicoccus sp. CSK15P-2]|uniref:type II toxin-antitoxin system VapC family toxin n=1 Tax=Phycicoccus sp. CSK15P-2 TaxID=2807627 RepID=UPI00194DC5D3|nr:type II toxin-antitoxin system VapC family toxin [Phycicoccus sp. CSK15P-2]MBM6404200.1 type II toxin-antitoxin system VapC family toxin [Phycicoccus sp. CSK15P-2]